MDRDAAPAWTVKVKGGSRNVLVAWQVLQDNGLPRQKVKGLEEVFASKGMIPTASEEKARMLKWLDELYALPKPPKVQKREPILFPKRRGL